MRAAASDAPRLTVVNGLVVEKLRRDRDWYIEDPLSSGGSYVFLTPVKFGRGFLTFMIL